MTVNVNLADVMHLAPNTRSSYREAIMNGQPVLDRHLISAKPLRVAHFMAQIMHESGGLSILYENLNYSSGRLAKVWPGRFRPRGPLDPVAYAHNPQRLANEVYGGRLGNSTSNDGFNFRGRGLLQLTGKAGYQEVSKILHDYDSNAPDLVAMPDEVIGPEWSLAVAAAVWDSKGCNAFADQDDIRKITRAINGGLIGLSDRIEWSMRTKALWK